MALETQVPGRLVLLGQPQQLDHKGNVTFQPQTPPWGGDPQSQGHEAQLTSIKQVSVPDLPKSSLPAVMDSSLPCARAEAERRLHPCQQEGGEGLKALQPEGTSAPVASAAEKLPGWTIPFGILGVAVAQPLPHLGPTHAATMQSALIARGAFEHVFINTKGETGKCY